jgi:hypothetical protein
MKVKNEGAEKMLMLSCMHMILYGTKTRFLVLYCLVSPFLICWQREEWEDMVQSCIPPIIICSSKDKHMWLIRYLLYLLLQVKKSKTTERRTVRHLLISTEYNTILQNKTGPKRGYKSSTNQSLRALDWLLVKGILILKRPTSTLMSSYLCNPPYLSLSYSSLLPRCNPVEDLLPQRMHIGSLHEVKTPGK